MQAVDVSHFPLRLEKKIDLGTLGGFFPVVLKDKKTGFYFFKADIGELRKEIQGVQRSGNTLAYDFNFGGHLLEGASAYYLAAALVASFNGRAFDPQSGKWLDSKELKKIAGELETMGLPKKASTSRTCIPAARMRLLRLHRSDAGRLGCVSCCPVGRQSPG